MDTDSPQLKNQLIFQRQIVASGFETPTDCGEKPELRHYVNTVLMSSHTHQMAMSGSPPGRGSGGSARSMLIQPGNC
jgi:hypothetical protein